MKVPFFFVLGIYPRPSVSALDMEMKRNEGESHKLLIVLFFPLKKNSTEQRGLEKETTKSCCFSESRRQLSGGPCRLFRKFFFFFLLRVCRRKSSSRWRVYDIRLRRLQTKHEGGKKCWGEKE